MSYAVWVAVVVTAGLFAADWWAVWHQRHDVERLAKPAAMVGLLTVALLAGATDSTAGRWLVLALLLGLVGDVLLLEDTPSRFVGGLAAFLVGHLAYVASFVAVGLDRPAWAGSARSCCSRRSSWAGASCPEPSPTAGWCSGSRSGPTWR